MKKISFKIRNLNFLILLIFLTLIFISNLQITFNSPIAFGDEGFHTHIARWVGIKKEIPVYKPLYGTKLHKEGFARPPFWNIFEASFYIFGFNEAIVKFLVPFLVFLSGLAIYILFREIFSELIAFLSSIIYVTIPSVVTYSVLFYTDILTNFWIILALGTFFLFIKTNLQKYFFVSAIFSGLAILTKTTGYFMLIFYFVYFLYQILKEKNKQFKNWLIAAALIFIILFGWNIRNYYYFDLPIYLPTKIFKEKVGVKPNYQPKYKFEGRIAEVSVEANVYKFGIFNYLQFAYGIIWFIPLLLFLGFSYIALRKNKFDIILLILLISSIPGFLYTFPTRAEDTARYTLYAIPFFAIIASIYFEKIFEILKKYSKYFAYFSILIFIILAGMNYLAKAQIMNQVKKFSPLFFEACEWVKNNLPKNATLLSLHTHPTVYNCERKAIWELIDLPDIVLSKDINLVTERLKANGITHIFVQKFSLSNKAYRQTYPIDFVKFLDENEEHFKKVFENGLSLNDCIRVGGCDGTIIYEVKV